MPASKIVAMEFEVTILNLVMGSKINLSCDNVNVLFKQAY